MFHLIQSNNTARLVTHLLDFYQARQNVFEPFTVIVPSMVLGDWLHGQIAKQAGISTLFVAQFWGKYQWQMMSEVLKLDAHAHPQDALTVPEVAVLSASIMRWRMYAFLSKKCQNIQEFDDDPVAFLLLPLVEKGEGDAPFVPEHRLWQVCQELANVYVRYLTHRPNWLHAWAKGESLQKFVQKMMADKAKFDEQFIIVRPDADELIEVDDVKQSAQKSTPEPMPEWLQEYYLNLERALHHIWQELFGQTYLYRQALEERFWQVLGGERGEELAGIARHSLKTLHLFTVQQIPQAELDFLKRLSQYAEVYLLHFNPSAMFWADIVDKYWLEHQQIINRERVYLKDYGHGLLSRLGKESRETFAMLVDMAGMGQGGNTWQDDFVAPSEPTLLNGIKTDILMLQKSNMALDFAQSFTQSLTADELTGKARPKTPLAFEHSPTMGSVSIHACHSLRRQLELAQLYIAQYLNTPKADGTFPALSDVIMLLPDVADNEELIRAVFPDGYGMDGLALPIKITGVPDKNIANLLDAMLGFYELLGKPTSRFYAKDVYEWLLNPALYQAFGLDFEQMKRGCELLTEAGFLRGFDERHLAQTLDENDTDYRHTFSHALDRVVLGLISPSPPDEPKAYDTLHPFVWQEGTFAEKVLPLAGVQLADEPIITALTAIHEGLHAHRHDYVRTEKVETILDNFENQLINRYFGKFAQTVEMRAIFNTKNTMMASLRANKHYHRHVKRGVGSLVQLPDIYLSYEFVLGSLSATTKSQAVSAEPSSVITVAKFGAVRSIPFGLTLMLGMNLSAFPRQDKSARLDLMKAGLKWRGDRHDEDDDNGAFLDALLCTDKVMIFYDGVSPDGKNRLLPASPVSEFLTFLSEEALWQEHAELGEMNTFMPKLIGEFLITHHSPTPFDVANFYHTPSEGEDYGVLQSLKDRVDELKLTQKRHLPPPPIWQNVRHVLAERYDKTDKVELMSPSEIEQWTDVFKQTLILAQRYQAKPSDDNARYLYRHVEQFGEFYEGQSTLITRPLTDMVGAFLSPKIGTIPKDEDEPTDEPLAMNNLHHYQVHEAMLNALAQGAFDDVHINTLHESLGTLYYGDVLPAGVMRFVSPEVVREDVQAQLVDFKEYLSNMPTISAPQSWSDYMTSLDERHVQIGVGGVAWGRLSERLPSAPLWLNVCASKPKPKHLLKFWVRHLLWQLADDGMSAGQKRSIWHFKATSDVFNSTPLKDKQTFTLPPIDPALASAYLTNLLMLAQLVAQQPVAMSLETAFVYILRRHDDKFSPKSAFKSWLEDVANDEHWQFVLGAREPLSVLVAHLPMAEAVFAPLLEQLAVDLQ